MFKVWVLATGEHTYSTNGREFDTVVEANTWGDNLLDRWYGAEEFAVLPVNDAFVGHITADVVAANRVQD